MLSFYSIADIPICGLRYVFAPVGHIIIVPAEYRNMTSCSPPANMKEPAVMKAGYLPE